VKLQKPVSVGKENAFLILRFVFEKQLFLGRGGGVKI